MCNNNELYNLIMLYKEKIQPYEFTYLCEFGTMVKFIMEPEEVCHLLFGSLKGKNIPNANLYKGISGYEAIVEGRISSIPYQLSKEFKSKSIAFTKLPELLKSPTVIYFNDEIVPTSKKGLNTRIDGDFLLYKEIENKNIHFFLKHFPHKNNRLIPYSTFHNASNDYTVKQKKIKVIEVDIKKRDI